MNEDPDSHQLSALLQGGSKGILKEHTCLKSPCDTRAEDDEIGAIAQKYSESIP